MESMDRADYGEISFSYHGQSGETGIVTNTTTTAGSGLAEKIIYTVSADIETVGFDDTIRGVYQLLERNAAFIENSDISGRNHAQRFHGWQSYRTAYFTLRVPVGRLDAVTASLDNLGHVISLRSDAQNITAQFTDTEVRLDTLRVQEERLLDMLRRADEVSDMIALEERLSNVRFQIESITAVLRNWQTQVDYSTVNLFIFEVEEFTEIIPVQQRTYWQRVGDGLQRNIRGVGNFFTGLLSWFIVSLPVLVILALIAFIIILIVRRQIRRVRSRPPRNYATPYHNAANPYMANQHMANQYMVDPQTVNPEVANPQVVTPQPVDPAMAPPDNSVPQEKNEHGDSSGQS
jgi:hypothetical protein